MQSASSNSNETSKFSSNEHTANISRYSQSKTNSTGREPKYHGSQKSKSDRHQAHNRKYVDSHKKERLERWYAKVTTPKVIPPPKEPISTNTVVFKGRKTQWTPKPRTPTDKKIAGLNAFKRSTHWVARSEGEYIQMHNH